jgi:hypothetical protein
MTGSLLFGIVFLFAVRYKVYLANLYHRPLFPVKTNFTPRCYGLQSIATSFGEPDPQQDKYICRSADTHKIVTWKTAKDMTDSRDTMPFLTNYKTKYLSPYFSEGLSVPHSQKAISGHPPLDIVLTWTTANGINGHVQLSLIAYIIRNDQRPIRCYMSTSPVIAEIRRESEISHRYPHT